MVVPGMSCFRDMHDAYGAILKLPFLCVSFVYFDHHFMNTSGKPFIHLMLVNPSCILTDPAIFIVTEWLHTRTQRN